MKLLLALALVGYIKAVQGLAHAYSLSNCLQMEIVFLFPASNSLCIRIGRYFLSNDMIQYN